MSRSVNLLYVSERISQMNNFLPNKCNCKKKENVKIHQLFGEDRLQCLHLHAANVFNSISTLERDLLDNPQNEMCYLIDP